MFELHLADGLTVSSNSVCSPLALIGNPGQGKTVFLIQLVKELVKNKQAGLLYDPYGDLAKGIQEILKTKESKELVKFIKQEDFIKQEINFDSFIIVSGKTIKDGAIYTREIADQVITKAYKKLIPENWLIIDQAFDLATEEILENYLSPEAPKTILSDTTFINLSEEQRDKLFKQAKQFIIYKPRNIDGRFIEDYIKKPTAKDIAAIKQYHFCWLDNNKNSYHQGIWPVEEI